jgi:CheY-like chemotaxis protein
MKVLRPDPFGLPRIDEVHPSVPLNAMGRALRELYDQLLAEGVPAHLASLVSKLDGKQATDITARHQRVALVVEDEPELRELAAAMLRESELQVMTCESAEAALAMMEARGGEVALVFADIKLAGVMDGVELAHSIVTRWPAARVIVTSGDTGERALKLPTGVAFIPKPWRSLELLLEVEKARRDANSAALPLAKPPEQAGQ